MSQREILAYLAGLLDADGTIGIKRNTYSMRVVGDSKQPTYSERIHIRQVERQGLDLLASTFGGRVTVEDSHAKRGRPLFRWGQTDKKAAGTLKRLLPYLRIKHAQAENCLVLRKVKEKSKRQRVAKGRGHKGSAPRSKAMSDMMQKLYLQAKTLNTPRI
jgi:hypothetical protein